MAIESRKMLDCRTTPSAANCTLTISGAEDEVLAAGAQHAVAVHHHTDEPALREALRPHLVEVVDGTSESGAFVQLIEFRTERFDAWAEIQDRFAEAIGSERATRWSVICADRDVPDTYLCVVEFPDYDTAMSNSAHPATSAFLTELSAICEDAPTFRNLDVRRARPY